jgi:hypothetical protein
MNKKTIKKQKRCIICNCYFTPHYKVGDRQKACSNPECQWMRQKLNQLSWEAANPPDHKKCYEVYGKPWQINNPDYFPLYRQKRKKEELTIIESNSCRQKPFAKKEELTPCYYLITGYNITIKRLNLQKKRS